MLLKNKPTEKVKIKGIGFTICESSFAQCLEQTKSALDVFYQGASKLPEHKVMLGVYGVARNEVVAVVDFIGDTNKSIMNMKHRQSLDVCMTFLKLLEDINLADKEDINDPEFLRFARGLIDFLSTLHTILFDKTTYYSRAKVHKSFIEKYIDYAPAHLQTEK